MGRAATLLAAVAGAAFLGVWWGARWPGSEPASTEVSAPPPLPPAGFASSSKTPLAVQAWLEEIEREKNLGAQAAAAARLAARLQPDEWPLVLSHLENFSLKLTRTVLEAAVVRRWAKHDPEAAVAWGLNHSGVLAAAAVEEWLKVDAASAQAWFDGLTPQQRAGHQLHGSYYIALSKQDLDAALSSILAHSNDQRSNIPWTALVALAPERLLAFAEKITHTEFRESIRSAVAREYGKRDASAAVTWAQQQPDADKLLPAVFQQLKEPPARMIPALSELAPDMQKYVLDKSWAWWERGDPFPTLDALRSASENLSDESRQHLVTRMMQSMTSHYDIAESVRRLESEWGDFAGMWEQRVAANWALDDAPAAARWTTALPEGEAKIWATWNLARQWHRVDAPAAMRWASAQPASTRAVIDRAFAGERPD